MKNSIGISVAFIALLISIASASSFFKSYRKQNRIVGGNDAERDQFPYYVVLSDRQTNLYFCGGAIITNRYILSAAHCIIDYTLDSSDLVALIGAWHIDAEIAQQASISRVNYPTKFEQPIFRDDIALLLTSDEIIFSQSVQPIALPTSDLPKGRQSSVIVGWGAIVDPKKVEDGDVLQPEVLQFQYTETIRLPQCRKGFKNLRPDYIGDWTNIMKGLNEKIICTVNPIGKGACKGDSGGPLVSNNTLIGISSTSVDCAAGYPDIYTKVYSHLDWIKSAMEFMQKYE